MREWEQWEWKDITEEKRHTEEQAGMEEGGNGKQILAEKKKGKARRRRKWKGTERDSKGAETSKENRKMEDEGDQREREKKCMHTGARTEEWENLKARESQIKRIYGEKEEIARKVGV